MAIQFSSDVGAPLVTSVVNIAARAVTPQWHDWIIYLMTAGGYIAGWQKWGGDFTKNIGVSSLPLAADKIYSRVRTGSPAVSGRMSYRGVNRYPAAAQEQPFQGVKLT